MVNTLYQKQCSSLTHYYFFEFLSNLQKNRTTNNKKLKFFFLKNTNIYIYRKEVHFPYTFSGSNQIHKYKKKSYQI
jgi:hypothetical protein